MKNVLHTGHDTKLQLKHRKRVKKMLTGHKEGKISPPERIYNGRFYVYFRRHFH